MKKRFILTFLVIALSILVGVILVGLSIFFSIFMFSRSHGNPSVDETRFHDYQSVHLDSTTNEYAFGMVSIAQELDENEFLFYNQEDVGISTLVSTFGSNEYHCTGKCFCRSEEDERRVSGAIISRLPFLLVAASSYVAYGIAKEYFSEECVNEVSNDCPRDFVMSEVEDCNPVREEESAEDEKNEAKVEEPKKLKYWCKGNCLHRVETFQEFKLNDEENEFDREDFDRGKEKCEKIEQEGQVFAAEGDDPVTRFQIDVLHDTCVFACKYEIEKSLELAYQDDVEELNILKEILESDPTELWSPCVGFHEGEINPTVVCRQQ